MAHITPSSTLDMNGIDERQHVQVVLRTSLRYVSLITALIVAGTMYNCSDVNRTQKIAAQDALQECKFARADMADALD